MYLYQNNTLQTHGNTSVTIWNKIAIKFTFSGIKSHTPVLVTMKQSFVQINAYTCAYARTCGCMSMCSSMGAHASMCIGRLYVFVPARFSKQGSKPTCKLSLFKKLWSVPFLHEQWLVPLVCHYQWRQHCQRYHLCRDNVIFYHDGMFSNFGKTVTMLHE